MRKVWELVNYFYYFCSMNLVADIGNTSTKLAVYSGSEKISVSKLSDLNCSELEKFLSTGKFEKAIISSVKKLSPFVLDLLHQDIKLVHILSYKSKLPFILDYETPESLGTDRIAAIAGAYYQFPDINILVIDAGTAITFDFLDGNIFKGGNISPGLEMRFKALNKFTDQLPLVSSGVSFTFPGRNTSDAIAAGVVTGVRYEINEYIRTFEKRQTKFKIILTGGDGGYLKEKIDHQITYMPDIVIDGLNYILEYNAK